MIGNKEEIDDFLTKQNENSKRINYLLIASKHRRQIHTPLAKLFWENLTMLPGSCI